MLFVANINIELDCLNKDEAERLVCRMASAISDFMDVEQVGWDVSELSNLENPLPKDPQYYYNGYEE